MEVHRQRCQSCGSLDLHNILAREPGQPTVIFVRCAECGELVARYVLSGYYHHGKGIESYLRSLGSALAESGRDTLAEFETVKREAIEGYETVLSRLREEGKQI
jgi:hypothetical protein